MSVDARRALVGALASAFFTLVVYLVSRRAGANWVDERFLEALSWRVRNGRVIDAAGDLRVFFDVGPYLVSVMVLLATVLYRGRVGAAAVIAAMLAGANLTTWALQHRVGDSRVVQILNDPPWLSYWPSGHTTASSALAVAVVLVSTPRWRPFTVVLCSVLAVLAAATNLVLRVHVPSDVVGAFGVAAIWAYLAVAAQRQWPALSVR